MDISDVRDFYANIMMDTQGLTSEQQEISDQVKAWHDQHKFVTNTVIVTPDKVSKLIKSLKNNCSPGMDTISAEHLKYGHSSTLCEHLACLYSAIISWATLPETLTIGIIIPVLKKPSLDPNSPSSYRPITLSSTHAKLLEYIMMPDDSISSTQFGFRSGRGTASPCSMLNDIIKTYDEDGSPLYMCSLDAEKCFDRLWHDGILYKMWHVLSVQHWMVLHNWYKRLQATVKWKNVLSDCFKVTRGVRQGSVLSPYIFNTFIDNLLQDLAGTDSGIRIGRFHGSSFVYADDITLYSATITGLQKLIDICSNYALTWRFNFNVSKSKCMILGQHRFITEPTWLLKDAILENTDCLEILGCCYDSNGAMSSHIDKRLTRCRQSFYKLSEVGLSSYSGGLNAHTKSYLWKSMCLPTLVYGCECIALGKCGKSDLDSCQGSLIKQTMGIGKRSHHSHLLNALKIPKVCDVIDKN